jgi:hypothetical protein
MAHHVPLWQPVGTTVSDAPLLVHPLRLPVSNPPLVMPVGWAAAMVSVMVVEWAATFTSVPVMVRV